MVKGTSRRVVIVKPPVGSIFEEAIFILKDGSLSTDFDADKILREACSEADEYVRANCTHTKRNFIFPIILTATLLILTIFLLSVFLL